MPLIKVREDENLENALKRFKRKCEKSGILSEIKKRQHYEKPSVRKKAKSAGSAKEATQTYFARKTDGQLSDLL